MLTLAHNFIMKISSNFFHIIVVPTLACNFRCTYCYEEHISKRISLDNLMAIRMFLLKKMETTPTISIAWFGGEPLIESKSIIKFMSALVEDADKMSVKLFSDMTTNGYLLNKTMLEKLLSVHVRKFQISIDGIEQSHNKTRILKNGKGTYDQIMRNIVDAKNTAHDFEFVLRIHITPDNIGSIDQLNDYLEATFGGDGRFKFFYRPVSRLGGANDENMNIYSYSEHDVIKQRFTPIHENNRYRTELNEKCYACYYNSLVFMPDFKIGKCTVALQEQENVVGSINRDGSLSLSKDSMYNWIRYSIGDIKGVKCPWGKIKHLKGDDVIDQGESSKVSRRQLASFPVKWTVQ